MKTSVIEVRDLLSVLSVDEVEKRIRDVSGVKSATVNYEARNATVRYDETQIEVADIKMMVHQRGQQSESESEAKNMSEDMSDHKHEVEPTPGASSVAVPTPEPAVLKVAPVAPAAPAVEGKEGKE